MTSSDHGFHLLTLAFDLISGLWRMESTILLLMRRIVWRMLNERAGVSEKSVARSLCQRGSERRAARSQERSIGNSLASTGSDARRPVQTVIPKLRGRGWNQSMKTMWMRIRFGDVFIDH